MTQQTRAEDPRIPPIGSVPQAERMFRVNWVVNEWLDLEVPYLSADFVSRQGRQMRLVDIRSQEDDLGYVPGSDWVPQEELTRTLDPLGRDDPIVIISQSGSSRAGAAVKALKEKGFRYVAAMRGGVYAWRDLGYSVSYEAFPRAKLRPINFRWEAQKGQASLADVEAHVGDPLTIRWLKLAALLVHGRVSCVDGRDGSGVIGTPGGDAGEFALLLSAYERVTGRQLDASAVDTLLCRRIDEFGRFYAHTDVHASNTLIQALRADKRMEGSLDNVFHALEWRRFFLSPPEALRDVLLEHAVNPAHMGCGHMRLSLQNAADYGTRPELVEQTMAGIYRQRWEGQIDVEYSVLPGGHAEGGVLSIFMEEGVTAFGRIPLISPSSGDRQFFVAHPQVAGFLRAQQVAFLQQQNDVAPLTPGEAEQLSLEVHALGDRQTSRTLGALAKGLPLYQLRFRRDGSVRVVPLGMI
jgi:rhodanese-related sulfurtransferase